MKYNSNIITSLLGILATCNLSIAMNNSYTENINVNGTSEALVLSAKQLGESSIRITYTVKTNEKTVTIQKEKKEYLTRTFTHNIVEAFVGCFDTDPCLCVQLENHTFYLINLDSKTTTFTKNFDSEVKFRYAQHNILEIGLANNKFYRFNLKDNNRLIFEETFHSQVRSVAYSNYMLSSNPENYSVQLYDNTFYVFNSKTNNLLLQKRFDTSVSQTRHIAGYYGIELHNNEFYIFDLSKKEETQVLHKKFKSRISNIWHCPLFLYNSYVYITLENNTFYAFDLQTKKNNPLLKKVFNLPVNNIQKTGDLLCLSLQKKKTYDFHIYDLNKKGKEVFYKKSLKSLPLNCEKKGDFLTFRLNNGQRYIIDISQEQANQIFCKKIHGLNNFDLINHIEKSDQFLAIYFLQNNKIRVFDRQDNTKETYNKNFTDKIVETKIIDHFLCLRNKTDRVQIIDLNKKNIIVDILCEQAISLVYNLQRFLFVGTEKNRYYLFDLQKEAPENMVFDQQTNFPVVDIWANNNYAAFFLENNTMYIFDLKNEKILWEKTFISGDIATLHKYINQQKGGYHSDQTLLTFATNLADLETFRYLVDICDCNVHEKHLIHIVAQSGNVNILKYMIETHMANIDETDDSNMTPLMIAATSGKRNTVIFLLEKGAKPDIRDRHEKLTATEWAHKKGYVEVFKLLFEQTQKEINEKKLRHLVTLSMNKIKKEEDALSIKMLQALMKQEEKTSENRENEKKQSCIGIKKLVKVLEVAAKKNTLHDAKFIVEICKEKDYPILHHFAKKNNSPAITFLVKYSNIDVNHKNKDDQTAVHIAAENGNVQAVQCLVEGNEATCDEPDRFGRTPLHLACAAGKCEVVDYLISQKAEITKVDHNGWTPYDYALCNKQLPVILLLIKNGTIDANQRSRENQMAIHVAAEKGSLINIKYLVEEKQSRFDEPGLFGKTPVHIACDMKKDLIADYLLSKRASIRKKDNKGWTALHYAVEHENFPMVLFLVDSYKAPVNEENTQGETPLHFAARKKNKTITGYLIEKNANIHKRSNGRKGKTPIELYPEILEFYLVKRYNQLCHTVLTGEHRDVKTDSRGVDINLQLNENRETLVHMVLSQDFNANPEKKERMLTTLIKKQKAKVDRKTIDGSTTFHCLVHSNMNLEKKKEMALLLKEKGASPQETNNAGISAITLAQNTNAPIHQFLVNEL